MWKGLGLLGLSITAACGSEVIVVADGAEDGDGTTTTGAVGSTTSRPGTVGGGSTGSPGSTGSSTPGSTGTSDPEPQPDPAVDCIALCGFVYECGLEDARCPNFGVGIDRDGFLDGDGDEGCVATCEGPLGIVLASGVNPDDCDDTIRELLNLSADFRAACTEQ